MKKIYFAICSSFIFSIQLFAQDCVSLGGASNYTVTTSSEPDQGSGPEWGCYNGYPRKQTYWQFFYSPTGGDYTQSFSSPADLDWIVFDMGTTLPPISCPLSPLGWTQVGCDISFDPGGPTGPGTAGEQNAPTIAGHYYAVALILWEPLVLTFTFGVPQLNGANLGPPNFPGVLPIKLESFTAMPQGKNVLVSWVVSEEVNVSHYEVEFSKDGRNFSTIGKVTASNSRNYSMVHTNAGSTKSNYYRLKTVDVDGKIYYSEIRRVNFESRGVLFIYPIPAKDRLSINVASSMINKPAKITIISIDGKVLIQKQFNALSQTELLDVSRCKAGNYVLRIITDNEVVNKFIEIVK